MLQSCWSLLVITEVVRGPGRDWSCALGSHGWVVALWLGRGRGFLLLQAALVGFLSSLVTLLKQIFTLKSGNNNLVFLGCLNERLVQSLTSKSVLCWCVRTQELFALFVLKPSLISEHRAGGHVGVFLRLL